MPWVDLPRQFDWRVPGKRALVSFAPGTHYMTKAQAEASGGKIVAKPRDKKTTKAGTVSDAD